ncbi:E3 ubiquitin-protein ligase SDIR1-like [Cornus florida]|uniref:E3 ubiquitin-protein ligase SDIR1-like n=1 Tax=Cornus florida TaxID=4283 RepID=UPI00289762F5|nr:E3 ubiquitin-protein ligase SDIR1-like [Cornus florida]
MATSTYLKFEAEECDHDHTQSQDSFVVKINTKQRYQKKLRTRNNLDLIEDRYMGPESSTCFHVPNSLINYPLCLESHIENELSSTDRSFDPGSGSINYLAKQIFLHLLAKYFLNVGVALVDLSVEFEIVTVESVDVEEEELQVYDEYDAVIGDHNLDDGFLEIDGDEQLLMMPNRGASQSAIDGLKKEKFEFGCNGDDETTTTTTTCVVCIDDILVGTEFTRLHCSHVFHHQCIVQWLQQSNTCPICRYEIGDMVN